jgi:hypothetical protein
MGNRIPNIEYIYKIVNYIHILPLEKREKLTKLKDLDKSEVVSIESIIKKEKAKLLEIK